MAVKKIFGFWIVLDRRGAGLSFITWLLMLFANAVVVRFVVVSWFWSNAPRWSILPFTDPGLVVFGLYQSFLCLTWWTHFQAITTDPGSMEGEDSRDPPEGLSEPRRCKLCESRWKPPRAHHCKVCEVCIFKMDHHCPWINNCVGHNNQKLFILFAGYVIVSCVLSLVLLFISAACWLLSQNSWAEAPPPSSLAVLLSGLAAIECLGTILFVSDFIAEQHAAIETNSTLVESHQQTHGELSDYWGHFRQVFGDNWLLWPLPLCTAPRPNYAEPVIPNQGIQQAQPIDDEDNLGIAGTETEVGMPLSMAPSSPSPPMDLHPSGVAGPESGSLLAAPKDASLASFLSGFAAAFASLFQSRARVSGDASAVSALCASYPPNTLILCAAFLKEKVIRNKLLLGMLFTVIIAIFFAKG